MTAIERGLSRIVMVVYLFVLDSYVGMDIYFDDSQNVCSGYLYMKIIRVEHAVIFFLSSVWQDKWSKNLYIASICYGRTVS